MNFYICYKLIIYLLHEEYHGQQINPNEEVLSVAGEMRQVVTKVRKKRQSEFIG